MDINKDIKNKNLGNSEPDQHVSDAVKDTLEWQEANMRYWAKVSSNPTCNDLNELNELYELAAGTLEEMDYSHVLNPLNSDIVRTYPEKIKNYNIVSPIFMQLLGQFIKRIFLPIVYNKNSDIENIRSKAEYDELLAGLQQYFLSVLESDGKYVPAQTDEQGNPLPPPTNPEVAKKKAQSIPDLKSVQGQRLLEFIVSEENIFPKFRQMFYDFVVTKGCFSYRDAADDAVIYKRVPPQEIQFWASDDTIYLEEAEAVKRTSFVSFATLTEMFYNDPEFEKVRNDIQAEAHVDSNGSNYGFNSMSNFTANYNTFFRRNDDAGGVVSTNDLYQLDHVQWTSYTEIYRIFTLDEDDEPVYIDVTSDYIPDEGEEVQKMWVKEKREGYMINDSWIFGVEAVDNQRGSFNNPNKCKNNYSGLIFMRAFPNIQSIAKTLYPYQLSFNTIRWKINNMVNKNKDKLAVVPMGLLGHFKDDKYTINDEGEEELDIAGSTEGVIEQAMYYADVLSTLFVDETSPNFANAIQGLKSIDLSLGQYIEYLHNYAERIKAEAEELIGFNRFVKANINSSDRVSNVNQGVYAGSLITEEYFVAFNEFVEKECLAIIDYSKFAFRNGKRQQYHRSSGEIQMLKIEPGDLTDTEFGVFVKNGQEAKENLDFLKQHAQSLIQNGMKHSTLGKMVNGSVNFETILQEIEEAEEAFAQSQQAAQEAQQQALQAQIANQTENLANELKFKYFDAQLNSQTKIEIAYKDLIAGTDDPKEKEAITKLYDVQRKILKDEADNNLQLLDLRIKEQELALKEKISNDNVKIATVNKN